MMTNRCSEEEAECAPWRLRCQAAYLKGIHEILNQEEASHLLQAAVDVGQTGVHVLAEGLGGNADIHIYQRSAEQEAEKGEGECREEAVCQKNWSF